MTRLAPVHRAARHHVRRWWAAAAVLALVVVAGLAVRGEHAPDPVATTSGVVSGAAPGVQPGAPDIQASVSPAQGGKPAGGRTGPGGPERLVIPAIGVSTDLVPLGLNADETVEVPAVPAQAGWYELGPAPGEVGSAVVLGHVDSREGPAVFHRLDTLVPDDRIRVRLSGGAVERFRVVRVATYANEDFPAQRVYAGTPRRATLTLITCGGEYDPSRGGYQANVVVFTEKVRSRA